MLVQFPCYYGLHINVSFSWHYLGYGDSFGFPLPMFYNEHSTKNYEIITPVCSTHVRTLLTFPFVNHVIVYFVRYKCVCGRKAVLLAVLYSYNSYRFIRS